jgi:hypothetical protein
VCPSEIAKCSILPADFAVLQFGRNCLPV